MERYLKNQILKDLSNKMVMITGPRQVGKTYLAKQIMEDFDNSQYLNWDDLEGRRLILDQSWKLNRDLLVFDEIHKMKDWKSYIKGVYDTKPVDQAILVTGSARLGTFKKGGESLAGRFFHLHLNPLTTREVKKTIAPYEAIDQFSQLGTFPEPFLSGSIEQAARWRNQYFNQIIREDILDFSRIQEIRTMKLLIEMLRSKVGSPLSINSLAEDLQVSPTTITKYTQILEDLYIIFLIRPYHKLIYRSIKQSPKVYFYDPGYLKGDEGVKLENICAVHLLKYVQYQNDLKGDDISLHYLRNKEKKEVDFVIVRDGLPAEMLEIKLSDKKIAPGLHYFKKKLPNIKITQLVHNLRKEFDQEGIQLRRAGDWLANLPV